MAGRSYFEKVMSIVPADLKFAIEDVTENDSRAVGVKWCVVFNLSVFLRLIARPDTADIGCRHVEVDGNEFPFSRGASFYELDSEGRIVYARDLVEPAVKPGSAALWVHPVFTN